MHNIEGPYSLYVGATAYFARMYIYCFLTVWATNHLLAGWKKDAGLKEWQI